MGESVIPNDPEAPCLRCQRNLQKKRRGLCWKCYGAGRTRFLYPEYKRGPKGPRKKKQGV